MKSVQLSQERAAVRAAKSGSKIPLLVRRLWSEAKPIAGTLGEAYFRGIGYGGDLPKSLRFQPSRSVTHPQIIAAVQTPEDHLVAVGLVVLDRDRPVLADLPKSKFIIGDLGRGAVRLAPPSLGLRVVISIEDALLLRQAGTPAWAALHADRTDDVIVPSEQRVAA